MKLAESDISNFQNIVWNFYLSHKRSMPWRDDTRPYYILVSEIMLQQTQVSRVVEKFTSFIERFPDFESLAEASLADVLQQWVGLGYNRRARYLKLCADAVCAKYNGNLPASEKELIALPGIGHATASAILNYAFNISAPYIETNVRTVYFHHFFTHKQTVSDKELMSVVALCHDINNPREWCWAIMDYGSYLKKNVGTLVSKSQHYTKQSRFEGSLRQKRGQIIRELVQSPASVSYLADCCAVSEEEISPILLSMQKDGLLQIKGSTCSLKDN